MMTMRGPHPAIESDESPERNELRERIDATPCEIERMPFKTVCDQAGGIFARGRHEVDAIAVASNFLRQWLPEIVEIPVGVCEEQCSRFRTVAHGVSGGWFAARGFDSTTANVSAAALGLK